MAFDTLKRFLGMGKAEADPPRHAPVGHRGIAAGDLRPGMQDLSAENVGKWRILTPDEVEAFLYDELILFVHSSWLSVAQYFPKERELKIGFLDGAVALVHDVTHEIALEFAKAQSKGGFFHDVVLGRPWYPGKTPKLKVTMLAKGSKP